MAARSKRMKKRQLTDTEGFLLRFPQSINTTDLSISYMLYGSFGGYGSFVRTELNTWEYLIPIVIDEKAAKELKVIIYCRGYGIALLDIPALEAIPIKIADIELKPLPTFLLFGRIKRPNDSSNKEVNIEVLYVADWSHEFYGIFDGMVQLFDVASGSVEQDGSFLLMIPDFTQDPVVNSFKHRGSLELSACEVKTGNIPYILERAKQPGRDAKLAIDERPDELILKARPKPEPDSKKVFGGW